MTIILLHQIVLLVTDILLTEITSTLISANNLLVTLANNSGLSKLYALKDKNRYHRNLLYSYIFALKLALTDSTLFSDCDIRNFLLGTQNIYNHSSCSAYSQTSSLQNTDCDMIKTETVQFEVGKAYMITGDVLLVINDVDIIANSVSVNADGIELPVGIDTRFSYTVTYTSEQIRITFNQGVFTDQLFIIKYEKTI